MDNIGVASPTPSMMKLQTMPPVNYGRGGGATSPMSPEAVVSAPLQLNSNRGNIFIHFSSISITYRFYSLLLTYSLYKRALLRLFDFY